MTGDVAIKQNLVRHMVDVLKMEASLDTADGKSSPADFVYDIMDDILSAETEEGVYEAQEAGTTASKNFVGIPFRLREDDIAWRYSGMFDPTAERVGFPFYAVVKVTRLDTGEEETISGGGTTFVASLFRLRELGVFSEHEDAGGKPLVITSKRTGAGYDVLFLKPYPLPKSASRGKGKS